MSEPHTLESFDALPDDAARDAAIAGAVGGRKVAGTWTLPGHSTVWTQPPPVYSGGDADPFANWHLFAEVWRALRNAEPSAAWSLTDLFIEGDADEECWNLMNDWDTFHATVDVEASTPHRAACLGLVAGGLVPKEDSP